jgi:imidazoleglycerol-phosphate dehydratase
MENNMQRKAPIQRKSNETQITGSVNIDGRGKTKIKTPIGLLSHMLELFAFHGYFDLELIVKGDTHIDIHHTNEDIGLALGKAFKKALGDEKLGIKRFGWAFAPMEDNLGHAVIDISGRGHFKMYFTGGDLALQDEVMKKLREDFSISSDANKEEYSFQYLEHFLDSFAKQLGANIIVTVRHVASADLHTVMETIFKSLGMALDQATTIDPRREGHVPSTKGIID